MEANLAKNAFGAQFVQIAWVVKDINAALKFYREVMGIDNFGKPMLIRAKDYDATYYGKPSDAETLTAMAYSGGTFIELIQPLSGNSIFHDYLDKNPAGGVQHVAYSVPVAQLDNVISEFADKGFEVISRFNTPPAQIVFFDTSKEIGVMTEMMGITKEGEAMVENMKSGKF
ncbi:MAG: VOC family protein [Bacteroidota bacterium]